ncbi:MAG: DsbE family thiol:disulfide interchange protein [Alphaproteobacteria bacterium]|nr:DsbE family thiol:disulfide interchange protein [Alphaproteobacteria bacterium]
MHRAIPLVFLIILCLLFLVRLIMPPAPFSPLVGQAFPATVLPAALDDMPGFDPKSVETPALVNFFASWCTPCRAEQPLLHRIARSGLVNVYGIAYRDKKADLEKFIADTGNPFAGIGADNDGSAGVAWGVTGVPETFLIGHDGRVLLRIAGPLTDAVYMRDILPLIQGGG